MKLPIVETYQTIDGKDDYSVIRDDIPFPFPSPNFSKIRGLEVYMKKLSKDRIKNVAIQDTIISRCGWGTSYVAKKYKIKVYNFYSKRPQGIDFYRAMSESFGATTIPVIGTHQRIAVNLDKEWLKKNNIEDVAFMPIGLNLSETITEHIALVKKLPPELFEGTLVVCVSSGTIISGIIAGIGECGYTPDVIGVQIHKWVNRESLISEKIYKSTGKHIYPKQKNQGLFKNKNLKFVVLDSGFTYNQKTEDIPPFPCDPYLDRKAWCFLEKFHATLKKPITFWNIGGEWNPDVGICDGLRGDGKVTSEKIYKYLEEKKDANSKM